MPIRRDIPNEESYNFVFTRKGICTDKGDTQAIQFQSYAEVKETRLVEFQGEFIHALFIRTKEAAQRAACMGWQEITPQWKDILDKTRVVPTTPSQKLIVDTLNEGEWKSKKDIVEAANIKDTEWRTAIKTLMERDIVECNFSKHARKRASNRKYMYRLVPA
tara:strand:+ start:312 stop:797 length:486 start_codon:yes stop_codon:yes gene_type:complete